MELYIGNNCFVNLKQIWFLKELHKLIILYISGNENFRIYVTFNQKKLKVLDGLFIETTEIQKAYEAFSGWLTDEILESRSPNMNFPLMKELYIS